MALGQSRSRVVVFGVVGAVIAALAMAIWLGAPSRGDEAESAPSVGYSMAGTGMEPTLSDGDPFVARESDGDQVARGDVVVIELPPTVVRRIGVGRQTRCRAGG